MSLDQEIREWLAAQIAATVADAIVFDYWVLGEQPTDWPGVLRKESGDVQGFVIRAAPMGQEPPPQSTFAQHGWEYRITALWSHKGRDYVNAFGEARGDLMFALPAHLKFTLSGRQLRSAAGLQWPANDIFDFNHELIQYAEGTITFSFKQC